MQMQHNETRYQLYFVFGLCLYISYLRHQQLQLSRTGHCAMSARKKTSFLSLLRPDGFETSLYNAYHFFKRYMPNVQLRFTDPMSSSDRYPILHRFTLFFPKVLLSSLCSLNSKGQSQFQVINFDKTIKINCRSQWPRGLRRMSAAARLLRLQVRIPPGAWMSVCCECCVLSGRGLCDELITRTEESYRLWCVVVCDLEIS